MTCAQSLLRLLWGGAEVGVLRDWYRRYLIDVELFLIEEQMVFRWHFS